MRLLSSKQGNVGTETDTHTEIRPSEDVGRDGGGASTSQGTPKSTSKPPESRGEAWK